MNDEIRLTSELTSDTYKNSVGFEIAVVKIENNVLITAKEMAKLYGLGRPTITRHLLKLYATHKLKHKAVCFILSHRAEDGKLYETRYYRSWLIIKEDRSRQFSDMANCSLIMY